MTYAKGGYIPGSGEGAPVRISPDESVITASGDVFRLEPCGGGYVLKPTGEHVDFSSALKNLNTTIRSAS